MLLPEETQYRCRRRAAMSATSGARVHWDDLVRPVATSTWRTRSRWTRAK